MTQDLKWGQLVSFYYEGHLVTDAKVVRAVPDADGDILVECKMPGYSSVRRKYVHKDEVTVHPVAPQPPATPKPTEKVSETMNETQASRSVVDVTLIDRDAGLKPEKSVVANLGQFVVENGNYDHVKQRILMDTQLDIAGKLAEHNKMRENTVDLEVLKRTGNKVKLQPVEIFQLEWSFK